jgi:pimeloyl-ACP methyl ester carboxylesterase
MDQGPTTSFVTASDYRLHVRQIEGDGAPADPRPLPWPDDVLEQEAEIVLPALLKALGIDRPVLIGHSDGGTIALLCAAAFAERVSAVITLAAHVFLDSGGR